MNNAKEVEERGRKKKEIVESGSAIMRAGNEVKTGGEGGVWTSYRHDRTKRDLRKHTGACQSTLVGAPGNRCIPTKGESGFVRGKSEKLRGGGKNGKEFESDASRHATGSKTGDGEKALDEVEVRGKNIRSRPRGEVLSASKP